jgi:hypothetical protein
VIAALAAALALGACGESKEDKAMSSVCSARDDISKQVQHLKSLTLSTASLDDVRNSLKAITSDLSKIKDAQGDLSPDRKQKVQQANEAFTSKMQSIAKDFGTSLSLSGAKEQAGAALQQLASAYQSSLAPIDCS